MTAVKCKVNVGSNANKAKENEKKINKFICFTIRKDFLINVVVLSSNLINFY